jgi:hypothetical protein
LDHGVDEQQSKIHSFKKLDIVFEGQVAYAVVNIAASVTPHGILAQLLAV